MDAERFEYLMNELFYAQCLSERRFGMFIWKLMDWIFYPLKYIFMKFIFTEKHKRSIEENKNMVDTVMDGIADNLTYAGAWQNIYPIVWSVPWVVCWILLGIIIWTFGNKGLMFAFLPFVSLYLVYAYVKWAIDDDNKRKKYLKKFRKRDTAWQKKMERIGFMSWIIALILYFGGFFLGTKLCDGWLIGHFIEKG